MTNDLARRNRRLLLGTLTVVAVMIGVAFASVPLYTMLCKVTGWGGTTQEVQSNPFTPVANSHITVRFDANVAQGMPWRFRPDLREVTLPVGGDGFISFVAENPTSTPVTGTAVYNVTPLKAGKYFNKTQCFCFGEQVLAPHQTVHMPVAFFVDPAIMKDPELAGLKTITLSYTFFKSDSQALDSAMETFYKTHETPAGDVKI